jgi:hypothetical protein
MKSRPAPLLVGLTRAGAAVSQVSGTAALGGNG